MHEELFRYGLTAFVTLLVVVDPFGIVPIYTALTALETLPERRDTLRRAVSVAFGVALFFLVAGQSALRYIGVTINAFGISGGILLFATALPMLFGQRGGLQGAQPGEPTDGDADVSVFPLAIPLLSGPGTLTTILLLTSQTHGNWGRLSMLTGAMTAVFLLSWIVLRVGEYLMAHLGARRTRSDSRTRPCPSVAGRPVRAERYYGILSYADAVSGPRRGRVRNEKERRPPRPNSGEPQ